ncbi:PRC-barrel domain-containing protein [Limnofasciculus baicalensis]|uniref:PRC-barrel domain-containing protein n=1 Tax=Limnofasciculus baicalensis BBK-W-15 TaxID=2699891 RepID=A0AAE3KMB3_9CYAN|nr:PRC-barrel domain-containing protein [Limnofasciculus baicalensis]MCP2728641.1 PRC-barrel domain-containing protein [Limnofasciculus baicalensis BBK-W-15]
MLYKRKDIIGKPIVSYDMGEKFDTVEDLIFDQDSNQLLGFLIDESGWFSSAQVLLLGDKIQEFGRIASEKAQETAHVTGDKIQEFGRSATTSITNAIVDPEEQKAFVIGKTVEHNVVAPGGQSLALQGQIVTSAIANSADYLGVLDELYRATGGSLSDKIGERVGNVVAGLTVEQAEGRRIRQVVRSDEGSIIAAPGQIVTAQVIERAKTYHQEQALLEAVGLSIGKSVRDSTSSATIVAGDRLKSTTQNTGEQLQSGAKSLWAQVKDTASGLQDRGSQAIEEKQIKGALGRPVTRVILDRDDDVILNVGELITHEAIASSRQSQVLDLLLSSVYSEKPRLSLENLRAPKPGRAAL